MWCSRRRSSPSSPWNIIPERLPLSRLLDPLWYQPIPSGVVVGGAGMLLLTLRLQFFLRPRNCDGQILPTCNTATMWLAAGTTSCARLCRPGELQVSPAKPVPPPPLPLLSVPPLLRSRQRWTSPAPSGRLSGSSYSTSLLNLAPRCATSSRAPIEVTDAGPLQLPLLPSRGHMEGLHWPLVPSAARTRIDVGPSASPAASRC